MNARFSEDLLLTNRTGKRLFEDYARNMPIIDYHCHLSPQAIYQDRPFEDLGEMWLSGDHYKWRAMRTFGIDERLITGDASYYEKYMAFSSILPQLIGNPLYVWCALELKRFFGIDEAVTAQNAGDIYRLTKKMIEERRMSPRWCMEASGVEMAATTEDPLDDLSYHKKLAADKTFHVRVLSAFRPDKSLYIEKDGFADYVKQLAQTAGCEIATFDALIASLEKRLIHFQSIGTMISDTGIEGLTWREATKAELDSTLRAALNGEALTADQVDKHRSAFMSAMGELYHRHGFVMQVHIGTYRDANRRQTGALGPDTGHDATRDECVVQGLGALLNRLNEAGALPKTILYPLNPDHAEPLAILASCFCSGGTRAKVQLGAPWWFNDQAYGIDRQFRAVSSLYPLSLSVGMLTDSRSFLSYPRHELYRRVLCNYLGEIIERGEYFGDEAEVRRTVENVCYQNAKAYFGL